MGQMMTLVNKDSTIRKEETVENTTARIWRERPISDTWLYRGVDEAGRRGWFIRLELTGLYPRRVGPFATRAAALDRIEAMLAQFVTEPLTELQNDLAEGQTCVVEGVPRLTGRTRSR